MRTGSSCWTLFAPAIAGLLVCVIGRAGASPPSRTTGTIFLYNIYICVVAPAVSPDTVSLLNVSTHFYLGVHAVRNIATTV